jgi:hypothetical protein
MVPATVAVVVLAVFQTQDPAVVIADILLGYSVAGLIGRVTLRLVRLQVLLLALAMLRRASPPVFSVQV